MKRIIAALAALFFAYDQYADPQAGAITAQNSTQYGNEVASPPVKNSTREKGGKHRLAYFSFKQNGVGDIGSTCLLVTLPAGKVRLLKPDGKYVCSAFGAGRTLSLGNAAYIASDGTPVAAAVDNISDSADVSAAAAVNMGAGANALGTDPTILFDSKNGVVLQATVEVGTIPDAATLSGYFVYVIE
ncbi:MAG TPA: hypothetical protein VI298_08680 [Geobacteraceae bacterium]